ncbi:hypothetical protein SAMN04489844_1526 [Nocardioides exalbidus]|uniref:PH domain-containing protein n=1 Tax=Nocardioides exalbidus TaxID=402596 RepID=A0A1H4P4R9_9ACTN|nr:hypothetical protein [Nocardioides exalbidus]SEC02349.1 hypothetical protein SAMN04489844_1526 [Nocardioides exalbidus]
MSDLRRVVAVVGGALVTELALYRQLGRWITRRPDVPEGATPVPYARLATPVVWLFVFGSTVEVVAFDLILSRWLTFLRIPFLVLGIWGVVWMLGLMASYRMRPHLVTDAALHVRHMARTEVVVPLEVIASVRVADVDEGGIRALKVVDDQLLVLVSGRTNVQLALVEGTTLTTPLGEMSPAAVGLWVDEPREVAQLLRRRAAENA